jgi:tetratricopeptide (TPR) repeat protein
MGEELELPDEVFGFGSWLLWVLATRATSLVDRVFAAGPARPSRRYGMVDGHPVPTPSLVAWLLTAAEFGLPPDGLAGRDLGLDERQKVLRTIVSRAVGGEPRLFKDRWLRDLAAVCGLRESELEFLLRSRDDEGYPVEPAALRKAITATLRARTARTARDRGLADGFPAAAVQAGGAAAAAVQAGGAAAATRTLPRDVASFTGRGPELRQLAGAAAAAAGSGGVVGINAIGGMAGVGKTAFAVHVAHQLAPRFPDGQVFLPLHGHTPGQRPVNPTDALASLLQISGVPAGQIPPGLEARTALWRDRLAGKRLVLVLDDAVGHDQVRPLLPGTAGSLVLVTSRRHLTALEDVQTVSLDTLPPAQAAGLLVRLAARPGLDPADPAVREITRLCGCLPLAVGMLARQLHYHPTWTAAELAADLAAARDRLELMQAEDLSVAAAFDLSYQDLAPGQQRLFRRLGLHLGSDIDAHAAASLDHTDLATARRHLEALYDQYLLAQPAHGRYRLHDLIREHARSKAAADPPAERDAALGRLLDYYQHTAAITEVLLARQSRTLAASAAVISPPTAVPDLPDRAGALAWARTERANLLVYLDHATRTGQHARVVALTAAIAAILRQDGPWTDAITRHTTAVQAGRHLGDRAGEAGTLNDLGDVRYLTDDYPGAVQVLEEALSIYRDLGDRLGQANALNILGPVRKEYTGDHPGAAEALEEALSIYRDLGDRRGEANALSTLGIVREETGDYPGAAEALEEALSICRDLGDSQGESEMLNEVGTLYRVRGDLDRARTCHRQALDLARKIDSAWDEAHALAGLGRCALAEGRTAHAKSGLRQALEIFQRIGAAEATGVSTELDSLTEA